MGACNNTKREWRGVEGTSSFKENQLELLALGLRSAFLQVPLVVVDSYYYGKLVVAPLNIVLYNVFTPHGPDLYGEFGITGPGGSPRFSGSAFSDVP